MLNAEVITIGDELLIGQTIDTNSAWIGQQLNSIGIHLYQITSVSDERTHILRALKEAGERSSIVLITGGLGPTKDDVTKETLCEYFETRLVMHDAIRKGIEDYFISIGRPILDSNVQQAMLPENCTVLPNTRGTASGMWFEKNGTVYVSMPGVPYEMKGLMGDEVIPRIRKQFRLPAIFHKTIMTQGIGESFLAEIIGDWENELRAKGLKLAYLPSPGIVKLRISAYGSDLNALKTQVLPEADKLKLLIPEYIFGEDDISMEEAVARILSLGNYSVAVAESCTGGALAEAFSKIPGASKYFMGGVVAYANQAKTALLGVDPGLILQHGAVSGEVVKAMAMGARTRFGVDLALATSGVAGPDGGSPEKPVGTVWIALASSQGARAVKYTFGKDRSRNIRRSVFMALDMLRKEILSESLAD